jgi:hypothetical protein
MVWLLLLPGAIGEDLPQPALFIGDAISASPSRADARDTVVGVKTLKLTTNQSNTQMHETINVMMNGQRFWRKNLTTLAGCCIQGIMKMWRFSWVYCMPSSTVYLTVS